ncbi:E3 ubiquitin-protein ligase TRIM56-like [Amphiura filiformis]|uniref:E3 ubiquitin-protein ligase TRIM56-like n=1 Tax=Amphiura filiformis TaxID=82378 RepID=UPI003B214D39
MAAHKLIQKLDRDLLECGICLDQFKQPRGLPCLHCFCHDCLDRYCRGKNKFLCPNCKNPTAVPKQGVSGFPAHFMVNTLQDTVDKVREEPKTDALCSNCNLPDKKATVRCLDCKELFCHTCRERHDGLKAMQSHKMVSIEDLRSGKVVLPMTTSEDWKCTDHDGEVKKFYCETCGKPICRDCIILDHRQHQYISLKEASEKQVAKLKHLTKGNNGLKKEYREAIAKTKEVEKNLSIALKQYKKDLQKIKKEYDKQVDAIFQKHEADGHSLEVRRAKELSRIKEDLNTTLDRVEDASDLATKIIQMGSDYEITSIYSTLTASFEELGKMPKCKAADESLGYVAVQAIRKVEIPDVVCVLTSEHWKLTGQFSTKSELECL